MIVVVDVGNTNITVGMFAGEQMVGTYRMTTQMSRTSDEFGVLLKDFLSTSGFCAGDVEDVIVASVVPNVMYSFTNAIKKYLNKTPLIVGPGTKTGIKIGAENPKEVGADLIVDAVAVHELYGGPAIVVDFGTATTYELILADGTLDSVVICPGIRISVDALFNGTAKIPDIEIRKPKTILAKETTACFQAGIVYGTIGQVEYIVNKMKEESGLDNIKVIATGGLGRMISDETDAIDIFDGLLTLQGLRLIRNRCRGIR